MMSEISRRSVLAGIAGMGALTIVLGSVSTARAEPSPSATTEEWLLGTQGALFALGDSAPVIQDEVFAAAS